MAESERFGKVGESKAQSPRGQCNLQKLLTDDFNEIKLPVADSLLLLLHNTESALVIIIEE